MRCVPAAPPLCLATGHHHHHHHRRCRRGSYLCFTGSRAFQQVLATKHTFLHRQAIIALAGSEPLTEADWARIKVRLGWGKVGWMGGRQRVTGSCTGLC